MPKYPITDIRPVWMIWLDAANSNDWLDRDTASRLTLQECHTLAWVINETADLIHFVPVMGKKQDDTVGGTWVIPKRWIKDIVWLPQNFWEQFRKKRK
jgi:hypothetical protein